MSTSPASRRRWRFALFAVLLLAAGGLLWGWALVSRILCPPYRCVPARASFVSLHSDFGTSLSGGLRNPLVVSSLSQVLGDSSSWMPAEDDPLLRRLTGAEAVLAYAPASPGHPAAWYGVAAIGPSAFSLQTQLRLFRPDGYLPLAFSSPLAPAPRKAWLVQLPDLPPRQRLAIAFRPGLLLAALSEDPSALDELLLVADGRADSLFARSPDFASFASAPTAAYPDRVWWTPDSFPGALHADAAFSPPGTASAHATLPPAFFPPFAAWSSILSAFRNNDSPAPAPLDSTSLASLSSLLGDTPCALLSLPRPALSMLAQIPELDPTLAFAARMSLVASTSFLVAAVLDGPLSGHLSWGPMRSWGLAGFRVPTLLLAVPAPDGPNPILRNLSTVCDLANRRFQGTFSLHPITASRPAWQLGAADPAEWVNILHPSERPAAMFINGWFVAASNLDALEKLAARTPADSSPAWAAALAPQTTDSPSPAILSLRPARTLDTALDLAHSWNLLARFLPLIPIPREAVSALSSTRSSFPLPPSLALSLAPDASSPDSPSLSLHVP